MEKRRAWRGSVESDNARRRGQRLTARACAVRSGLSGSATQRDVRERDSTKNT